MNFLDKKSLLTVLIILIAVAIGFVIKFGDFFYWHKNYVPEDNIPLETVKAKCLKDVSKMTDNELIDEIENFKNSNEISVSTKENLLGPLYRNMIDYLICEVEYDNGEENYNRAKNFMESLTYTSEENKQSVLNKLDDAYKVVHKNVQDSLTLQLALGDLNKICPDELPSICHECYQNNDSNKERILKFMDCHGKIYCDYVCEIIQKCFNDKNYFEEFFLKLQYNDPQCTKPETYELKKLPYKIENIGSWRIAIAYRIGDREAAHKICDIFEDETNNECMDYVNGILDEILDNGECDKKTIAEVVCY